MKQTLFARTKTEKKLKGQKRKKKLKGQNRKIKMLNCKEEKYI